MSYHVSIATSKQKILVYSKDGRKVGKHGIIKKKI